MPVCAVGTREADNEMRFKQLIVAGVLLLTGAGSVSAGRQPAVVQITIDQAAFSVLKKPLEVGDVVEWINNDVVDHTATEKVGPKEKGWDAVIRAGRKVRVEMKEAGKVDYICRFHPNMTGTLVVQK
jgi:plastocyanin